MPGIVTYWVCVICSLLAVGAIQLALIHRAILDQTRLLKEQLWKANDDSGGEKR